jgi:hypothetical protein
MRERWRRVPIRTCGRLPRASPTGVAVDPAVASFPPATAVAAANDLRLVCTAMTGYLQPHDVSTAAKESNTRLVAFLFGGAGCWLWPHSSNFQLAAHTHVWVNCSTGQRFNNSRIRMRWLQSRTRRTFKARHDDEEHKNRGHRCGCVAGERKDHVMLDGCDVLIMKRTHAPTNGRTNDK